ncbi:MAG: hypothetical protein Kow0029_05670 [Candidatus Rifleibacteriota bacterium]
MTEKANNPDIKRIVSDLETLKKIIKSFKTVIRSLPEEKQDERLFQIALQISELSFPELISDLSALDTTLTSKSDANEELASENQENLNKHFEELKSALDEKDRIINEFKLSLADTVIECKNLQKKNSELSEHIHKLKAEILQMQLHSKDLSMRLSTAEKNLDLTTKNLSKTTDELIEIKNQNYSLKSKNADLEDLIEDQRVKIGTLSENLEFTSSELKKSKKLSTDLEHSFNKLKFEHEALLQRSEEMENLVDTLQKEKNFLQKKLETLLTGIPKTVEYNSGNTPDTAFKQLEPKTFTAYIPFCFPNRLPSGIKLRKQIQQTFAKTFPKRKKEAPRMFPQDFEFKLETVRAHIHAFSPKFECLIPKDFSHVFPEIENLKEEQPVRAKFSAERLNYKPTEIKKSVEAEIWLPQKFLKRVTSYSMEKRLEAKDKPEFGIYSHSLDLLLSYLTRNILETNYRVMKYPKPLVHEFTTLDTNYGRIDTRNIFNEKLAFRYGYHLKSQRLNLHRGDFAPSFRRTAGLKSVLETFGNTINSMVKKYEAFSTRPGEKAKA